MLSGDDLATQYFIAGSALTIFGIVAARWNHRGFLWGMGILATCLAVCALFWKPIIEESPWIRATANKIVGTKIESFISHFIAVEPSPAKTSLAPSYQAPSTPKATDFDQGSCKTNFVEPCLTNFRISAEAAISQCERYAYCDPHSVTAYARLGQALHTLGRYVEAQAAFENELREGQIQNDQASVSEAYQNLASVSLERGLVDRAEYFAKKSLEGAPSRIAKGIAYRWLGDVAYKRGSLEDAEHNFLTSITELQQTSDKLALASAYIGLGMTRVKKGAQADGCNQLATARKIFSGESFPRGISDVAKYTDAVCQK
jgi:tetratricopeptide (TPR) repeat protein